MNDPQKLKLWRDLEAAKHRLIFTLIKLDLPMPTRRENPEEGLAFDFLVEEGSTKVLTGHDEGLVTLNASEADAASRVKLREEMGEVYRTLLGHFRHEIGHYFWDRLVRDGSMLDECRALFGDDRADYQASLEKHYKSGPPADWREHYVSAYATMHPWEDFAETFAHYLHILDALDTASSFGMAVHAKAVASLDDGSDTQRVSRALRQRDAGRVGPAVFRGQRAQPQHGPAGSLPVRVAPGGPHEARIHPAAGRNGGRHAGRAREESRLTRLM